MKDCEKSSSVVSALILLQGVVTMLFPQASVKLTKKMIAKNFDNASELEPNSAYLQQLRAIGVGMVAAGGTSLLLEDSEELEIKSTEISDSEGKAAEVDE